MTSVVDTQRDQRDLGRRTAVRKQFPPKKKNPPKKNLPKKFVLETLVGGRLVIRTHYKKKTEIILHRYDNMMT